VLAPARLLFNQIGLLVRNQPFLDGLVLVGRQPTLYAALAFYGFSTLLWIWILARVPSMQAYRWVGARWRSCVDIGWFAFGERVTPVSWRG
jgi:hypothetical protein